MHQTTLRIDDGRRPQALPMLGAKTAADTLGTASVESR